VHALIREVGGIVVQWAVVIGLVNVPSMTPLTPLRSPDPKRIEWRQRQRSRLRLRLRLRGR